MDYIISLECMLFLISELYSIGYREEYDSKHKREIEGQFRYKNRWFAHVTSGWLTDMVVMCFGIGEMSWI